MTSVFEQGDQGAASSLLFVSYYCQPFTGTQRTESYISTARNVSTLTNLIVARSRRKKKYTSKHIAYGSLWSILDTTGLHILKYGMTLFDFSAQLKFLLTKNSLYKACIIASYNRSYVIDYKRFKRPVMNVIDDVCREPSERESSWLW